MGTISTRIDESLCQKLADFAKQDGRSKSDIVRIAVEQFLSKEAAQRSDIPDSIKERTEFITQIVLTGTPDRDWELIQTEMIDLWKNMQSFE